MSQKQELLSETQIDWIIHTIPEIRNRAALHTHMALVEAERKKKANAATESLQCAKKIVAWLRETHTEDTVRAKYARKLADSIEAGDFEPK